MIGEKVVLMLLLALGVSAQAQHYVVIDGVIDTMLVLPPLGSDSAYQVQRTLTVVAGGDLHVEAGAKIFFDQSAYLGVDGGSLSLNGYENDSVYLLCSEFSHDWAGVQLKNVAEESKVTMSHVVVMGALTAVNAAGCSGVYVKHCSFNNYYAGEGIEMIDCSNFVVDSCFFYQCISGIKLKARTMDSENNLISNNIFDQGQINIEVSNVGYGFKCHNNVISGNCFQGAATAISFGSLGGISDKVSKNFILNNLISSEIPEGTNPNHASIGIEGAVDSLIIRNNIFWRNDEAVRMLRVSSLVFEYNTFYDNGLVMTNLLPSGSTCFVGNTFSEPKARIVSFPSGKSKLHGNNFLHYDKGTLLFSNESSENIDMKRNWWDTQSVEDIGLAIYDKHDNPALGEIMVDGFLLECDTAAPVSPPFKVKKQLVNGTWLVSWEENPERDFDHYALFYGDFNYYKFSHHIDSIYGTSCALPSSAENVAVAACDRAFDFNNYASAGKSAFAFATYYPYAGEDGDLCAPDSGFVIDRANIPYLYNRFVWRSSGSGVFSDTVSLRTTYYPSEADFDAGEVTLTLRVMSNGEVRTDAMQIKLFKQLQVFAGDDYYGGLNRNIVLDQATASNYDSLRWHSMGDGWFEDAQSLNTVYHPGGRDKAQGFIELVLKAWSFCGEVSDTVRFDLYEEFSLEGITWSEGRQRPNTLVVAAGVNDGNPFFSGFYRTRSDEEGRFRFESLLPDIYVLYAFADTLDVRAGGAYYLGDFQWNESNMIAVDGNVYDVDIDLPVVEQGFAVGGGLIAGVFDYPEQHFRAGDFYCTSWLREDEELSFCDDGLSNVGVILLNSTKQRLLGFTLTDASGSFRFGELPFGTYYVMADVPRYGRGLCEEITLSPEHPEIVDLHLYLNGRGQVAIRRQNEEMSLADLQIFPNPTSGGITVTGLKHLENYTITITNVVGDVVAPQCRVHSDLLGECSLSVHGLPQGVYFVMLTGNDESAVLKFIKY